MSRIIASFCSLLLGLALAFAMNFAIPGTAHAAVCYIDADSDGFGDASLPPVIDDQDDCGPGFSLVGFDCADDDDSVYPGAMELIADGFDQDCDGVDQCYVDDDLDSFGDIAGTSVPGSSLDCAGDPGVSDNMLDCDDNRADINPAAEDVPGDDTDQDCDGQLSCYVDADRDFWGSPTVTVHFGGFCDDPSNNVADDALDCNDANAAMFPGNPEICDGLDNDCDIDVDEGGVCDADSDGDSVPDILEFDGDTDGDGHIDALDPDDDNDGVPTIEESPDGDNDPTNDNTDDDNLPNYRDPDDDNDGYLTIDEAGDDGYAGNDDSDDDGILDYLDEDSDDDGVLDQDELDVNSDDACDGSCIADARPNRVDPDDDGDGVPTISELIGNTDEGCTTECASDAIDDYLDIDDDGDGIPTLQEDWNRDGDPTNDDTDGDGTPDYLDLDPVPDDLFEDGFESL